MFGGCFRSTAEFALLKTLLTRMLKRRGKDRQVYQRQIEDHFLKVWIDSQMNSKNQLAELMKDKKELRKGMIELLEEHKTEIDNLEREIEKLKSVSHSQLAE